MDCLRSFNISVSAQGNEPTPEFKGWQIGTQHFWLYESSNVDSIFNVEGFKNINVFKIALNGNVGSAGLPALSAAIVQNWSWLITINGQNSVIGGNVTASPNGFGMLIQPTNPTFTLSKFNPSIEFATPIQSAKQIIFNGFYCDGIASEVLTNAQLNWQINCTIFYKFEGE